MSQIQQKLKEKNLKMAEEVAKCRAQTANLEAENDKLKQVLTGLARRFQILGLGPGCAPSPGAAATATTTGSGGAGSGGSRRPSGPRARRRRRSPRSSPWPALSRHLR